MAVVGAVLVPYQEDVLDTLAERLKSLPHVEVHGVSKQGIAFVMEGESLEALKGLTEQIQSWQEVLEIHLAYVNWEPLEEEEECRAKESTVEEEKSLEEGGRS